MGPSLLHTQRGFKKEGLEVFAATHTLRLRLCLLVLGVLLWEPAVSTSAASRIAWIRDAAATVQGQRSHAHPPVPHPAGGGPGCCGEPRWGNDRVIIAAWGWDISSTLWADKWTCRWCRAGNLNFGKGWVCEDRLCLRAAAAVVHEHGLRCVGVMERVCWRSCTKACVSIFLPVSIPGYLKCGMDCLSFRCFGVRPEECSSLTSSTVSVSLGMNRQKPKCLLSFWHSWRKPFLPRGKILFKVSKRGRERCMSMQAPTDTLELTLSFCAPELYHCTYANTTHTLSGERDTHAVFTACLVISEIHSYPSTLPTHASHTSLLCVSMAQRGMNWRRSPLIGMPRRKQHWMLHWNSALGITRPRTSSCSSAMVGHTIIIDSLPANAQYWLGWGWTLNSKCFFQSHWQIQLNMLSYTFFCLLLCSE